MNRTDEGAHITDAVHIIAQALKTMYPRDNITEAPRQCSNDVSSWKVGKILQKYVYLIMLCLNLKLLTITCMVI